MLSRVPNLPALGLLGDLQGTLTTEKDPPEATHSQRAEKQKTPCSDEPDSCEVEEILGHHQDN